VRSNTLASRRRLYLLARVLVARHYARPLTLELVGRALACSPRGLQRAYEQFGEMTFKEDLRTRRMTAAAELLIEQRSIPVADVARLVGYRHGAHFARAFRGEYGVAPARFRELARERERAAARQAPHVHSRGIAEARPPRMAQAPSHGVAEARPPRMAQARSAQLAGAAARVA
jgi:AraC-like DNA-binding protein